MFSVILNFLRTRDVRLDDSTADALVCLRREALFYGITQLVTKLCALIGNQ